MTTGPLGFVLTLALLLNITFCNADVEKRKRVPLIVVSMDGVAWQQLDSELTDTPNFDFIARTGVKARNMIGVNPTSTFPTHMTYLTGLYPESHGIVGNSFYDPLFNESFYLETDCSNFDPKFYNESEPIWLTMEKRGRKSATYFWPSSTRLSHCKFDWFNDPYWHRIETAIKWLKSDDPPEAVFLYFEQSDYDGHRWGPNHRLYWQSLETTDRYAVGKLLRELKKADMLEKVDIIFVSDHSMIETSNKKLIDLYDHIDKSSYHGPGLWVKPDLLQELYNNLSQVNTTHMKVYLREDVPEEYHSRHNRRYPPLFLDVEMGWSTRVSPYDKDEDWTRGSHGWAPNDALGAIFYARGPSFKRGYNMTTSLRAVDLYPLMCHLLDMEPLPNNGSLDNMMDLLRESALNVM
ncbi:predicted protein, partial [Nematostella vectensis]